MQDVGKEIENNDEDFKVSGYSFMLRKQNQKGLEIVSIKFKYNRLC
jgi:hypothetical protein